MARFYGIFIREDNGSYKILDLRTVSGFERTGNLKSGKLYFLKEIINLTSEYDNELQFKSALFLNGAIELEDITKDMFICSKEKNDRPGNIKLPIIYKPLFNLINPDTLKEKFKEKNDVVKNYYFLKKLVKYYTRYRGGFHDRERYTSEIIIDEINSIIKNYDPNFKFDHKHTEYYDIYKNYFNDRIKELLEDFINHEVFYVIGKTPKSYERKLDNIYRIDKKTNKKQIDLYSLYKLVVFFVENSDNNTSLMGKASNIELEKLKEELTLLENEINKRRQEREQYKREAILLAEESMKDFLNPDIDYESVEIENKKRKTKKKKQS